MPNSTCSIETVCSQCFRVLSKDGVLPVGESLAHGKICICSGEGGIPEVGGEFVDYIDPYNVRDGLRTAVAVSGRPRTAPEPRV